MGPVEASDAGSPKTPEPTMLPITSAVAMDRPSDRLSFGRPAISPDSAGEANASGMVAGMTQLPS